MEGDYGAGKSAISQRFAYGLVEEGASVTVMSTELTVRGFIDQMHSLEYDMVKPLLQEELLFLLHADFDSGGAFSDDDGERKELLKRLMNAEAMWNSDVIFLDTFDAIFRNDPTFEALVRKNEERQAALEIISFFPGDNLTGEGGGAHRRSLGRRRRRDRPVPVDRRRVPPVGDDRGRQRHPPADQRETLRGDG